MQRSPLQLCLCDTCLSLCAGVPLHTNPPLAGLHGSMAFMQMTADELERYHKNHPKVMQVCACVRV